MDSLLSAQVKSLLERHASVSKTALIKGEKSQEKFIPDSLGWRRELQAFSIVESINKPVFKDLYELEIVQDGDQVVKKFSTKEEVPLRSLVITYDKNGRNLLQLEAVYTEDNSMYTGARNMSMVFDRSNLLHEYSISGGQKMLVGDSINYSIKGEIAPGN